MHTTVYSPDAPVQSLEPQNRPQGVLIERIDPTVLAFIHFLFPCQVEGIEFLALLCRRATEKQFAMFEQNVALITFHGITGLCQSPDWKWGYHATLRYFILFEALGILLRRRRNRTTEVYIPLGTRPHPLNREQLLQSLDQLQKQKPKKHAYKDKKLGQLIERVRQQITCYGLGAGDSEHVQLSISIDQRRLDSLQAHLISVMRAEHIPLAKCTRIAQWMCAHQIPALFQEHLSAHVGRQEEGDSDQQRWERPGRYSCVLGDSLAASGDSHSSSLVLEEARPGDSPRTSGDSQRPAPVSNLLPSSPQEAENRPTTVPSGPSSTLVPGAHTSGSIAILPQSDEKGDSERCLSSNISISQEITERERFDIDIPSSVTPVSESPQRDEAKLLAEATWIAVELDGQESLKLNRGKGWIGAYKTKLQENPYLVRVSLIDMFMQRAFPDWQGKPQGRGGKWFNKAYRAYALHHDPIPAEIESWARSEYSYEEIQRALLLERQRQEDDIAEMTRRAPLCSQQLVRPFADCVLRYRLFDANSEASRGRDEQGSESADLLALPDEEQELRIEMEDGSLLPAAEYEQLQLRALLADSSEEADELLGMYVEQWVQERLSEPSPALAHDLVRLKEVLPDYYAVDVQIVSRDGDAIRVREHGNHDNVCLLSTSEEVEQFIQALTHIPTGIWRAIQQLENALPLDLYHVELWLPAIPRYVVNVYAVNNPRNAYRIKGPRQIPACLAWISSLSEAVHDELQLLGNELDSTCWSWEPVLAGIPDGRYAIYVYARHASDLGWVVEGLEQARQLVERFRVPHAGGEVPEQQQGAEERG